MSARTDYPLHRALEMLNGGPSALDEIDRLRDALNALNPFRHDHNPLNEDFHGGICPACEWWAEQLENVKDSSSSPRAESGDK